MYYRLLLCLMLAWFAYSCHGNTQKEERDTAFVEESKSTDDEPLPVVESRIEVEIKILTQLVKRVQGQLKTIDEQIRHLGANDESDENTNSLSDVTDVDFSVPELSKEDGLKSERKVRSMKTEEQEMDLTAKNDFTSCGGVIYYPETILRFPNSGYYRNMEYCYWYIYTRGNITLTLEYLHVERCCDYLAVSVDGRPEWKLHNYSEPSYNVSEYIRLHFHSDGSNVDRGFQIRIVWPTNGTNTTQSPHTRTHTRTPGWRTTAWPRPTNSTPTRAPPKPSDVTYKFNSRPKTWVDAEKDCQNWSGHLATISSLEVNNYLTSELRKRNIDRAWIGFNDRTQEGEWKWVDGGRHGKYTNWINGQPDGGRTENCGEIVMFDYNGRWNDLTCSHNQPFICQKTESKEVFPVLPGKTNKTAAESCSWLNERFFNLRNGMYWVKVEDEAKLKYCDMEGGKVIKFPNGIYGQDDNTTEYFVEGHVEILHENEWGTICDDSFDRNNNGADVLCRMEGYKRGVYDNGKYKQRSATKSERIWLDEVSCRGTESSIDECYHSRWGLNDCHHSEDVGIRCYI